MNKVLILLTNQATMGDTEEKNGTYALELTHVLNELINAGYDYDLVSIKGGKAPIYGEDNEDKVNQTILQNQDFQSRLTNTIPVSQITPSEYVAVFYPGGFGLLWDLAQNTQVAKITADLYESGVIVGAVCHGPAGLLPVTLSNGQALLADKTVTGFSREEEIEAGTIDKIPFVLEEALTKQAADYHKIAPWGENVIKQDRLITGQNPASASAVGKAMVERLSMNR